MPFVGTRRLIAVLALVPAASAPRAHAPDHAEPVRVAIVGNDYAFVAFPVRLAAGPTRFAFENRGKVRHEMSMVLLQPGVTPEQALAAGGGGPAARKNAEQLIGLLVARPGESSGGELLVNLQAGRRYLVTCTLRDQPDAPPHVMLGMVASFEVF